MRALRNMCRLRAVPILYATVIGVVASTFVAEAEATFPGRNGRLAVSYGFGCERPIVATMKPDGTVMRELTDCVYDTGKPDASAPDWSPDGQRIVFIRGPYFVFAGTAYMKQAGIAIMEADGSRQRDIALVALPEIPVANDPLLPIPIGNPQYTTVGAPSFSPDGKHVVYTRAYFPSIGDNIRVEIWVAAVDGGEDRMLALGSSPQWSPDGRRIVYVAPPRLEGNTAVEDGGTWLMDARTGRPVRRIARRSLHVVDWSPDGRRLLYRRGFWELRVMRADGTGKRALTTSRSLTTTFMGDATFSPDGGRIAFSGTRRLSEDFSRSGIWMMTARGRQIERIYRGGRMGPGAEKPPPLLSWQPRPRG